MSTKYPEKWARAREIGPDTKFSLEIRMGNSAMMRSAEVASALRAVATEIGNNVTRKEGVIYDLNGGRVGEWRKE